MAVFFPFASSTSVYPSRQYKQFVSVAVTAQRVAGLCNCALLQAYLYSRAHRQQVRLADSFAGKILLNVPASFLHQDIVSASHWKGQSLFTRPLPGTRKCSQAQPDISIFTATRPSDVPAKQGTSPNIQESRLTHIPINVSKAIISSLILALLHILLACSGPWRLCLYKAYAGTSRCVNDSQGLAAEPFSEFFSWATWGPTVYLAQLCTLPADSISGRNGGSSALSSHYLLGK